MRNLKTIKTIFIEKKIYRKVNEENNDFSNRFVGLFAKRTDE